MNSLDSQDLPPQDKRRSSAVAKDLLDLLAKALPLIATTTYLAGFFVTASRLADYGVPITQLIDAQYFMAGITLGVLIWLAVIVGFAAYRYKPKGDGPNAVSYAGYLVAGLFIFGIVLEVGLGLLNVSGRLDLYLLAPVKAILGLAALFYLIAGLRAGVFHGLAKLIGKSDVLQFGIFLVALVVLMIVSSYQAASRLYTEIPQAYGGGKLMTVRLYMDRQTYPEELRGEGDVDSSAVYSQPVNLIFQTSSTIIVGHQKRPIVWTLDASAVHAVLFCGEATPASIESDCASPAPAEGQ